MTIYTTLTTVVYNIFGKWEFNRMCRLGVIVFKQIIAILMLDYIAAISIAFALSHFLGYFPNRIRCKRE